mmetsp:Transcript_23342/g.32642  ORF Transcript_23342/g.32642 Transcript_23342/m.32642 type:complete len:369 (+) Transcript_23342:144-1250(+)|eukprot:CAMPEP_0185257656 /NCGR_PEP_ID=MMETSP1359-20130426/6686_1 /TAXON_ID=552665 /ORGANISM="Bigelowiella longifila, Strain CCMP242" /LENGTH=368 /DNA_ID=CAMNT_0027842841 /DNA_START=177 /DNA_END=1286 /DNA_ORIENTATION=+
MKRRGKRRKRPYHEEEEKPHGKLLRIEGRKSPSTDTKEISNSAKSNVKILELLSTVCKDAFQAKDFDERLKNIKRNFFERNYEGVFSNPENLCFYAAQYVPPRAMCYFNFLRRHGKVFEESFCPLDPSKWLSKKGKRRKATIHCIGAGPGSEAIGISRFLSDMLLDHHHRGSQELTMTAVPPPRVHVHTYDRSDFSWLFSKTDGYKKLVRSWFSDTTFPASTRKATTSPILHFKQLDVLNPPEEVFKSWERAHLITFCFVVAELFKADGDGSLLLFRKLRDQMSKQGAMILVIESAGTFSFVKPKVGEQKQWLYCILDRLLLEKDTEGICTWECIAKSNSEWFRLEKGLDYPLKLNNMRYFFRLYRRK